MAFPTIDPYLPSQPAFLDALLLLIFFGLEMYSVHSKVKTFCNRSVFIPLGSFS